MGCSILFTVLTCVLSLYCTAQCSALTQPQLERLANDLSIRIKIVDNVHYQKKHLQRYYLTNTGSEPLPETNWTICYNSFRSVEPDYLPLSGSVVLADQFINVTLVQGMFTMIEPIPGFGKLTPGETRELNIFAELFSVGRNDNMPNWYVIAGDLEPRLLQSTVDPMTYVDPLTSPKEWKRSAEDKYHPFSAEERFERNYIPDQSKPGKLVIPTPKTIKIVDEINSSFSYQDWEIVTGAETLDIAKYLSSKSGFKLSDDMSKSDRVISLRLKPISIISSQEGYFLKVQRSNDTSASIVIQGQGKAGLFYGVQTFLSILDSFPDRRFPNIEVLDEPRFAFRGMHLDVARNFHGVGDVFRLIDGMAMYKMNKLHLHLADNEGWRLEIPDLPELTQVGAKRCHDMTETVCLLPQDGSGPFANTSGSGFYTIPDYKRILKYAEHHFIQVIPEFDMPGHAHAAIRAMETRYHTYHAAGDDVTGNRYRLADPEDTSKFLSVNEFNDNAINPCIQSTYSFIEKVVKEVIAIHRDIQPLKIFHFGGDEVASGAWTNSSACHQFKISRPYLATSADLKNYFVSTVAAITARLGVSLGGWEDGFTNSTHVPYPMNDMPNPNVYANAWNNIWEWGSASAAYRLANVGYKVVMSQATHLYFDHPYEPDPEERGLSWATRYTDTRKVFDFRPDALYDNIDTLLSGEPTTKSEICNDNDKVCDVLRKPENIMGVQGNLWTEITRTSQHMDFMIYPRILALAERAWHKAEWEESKSESMRKRQETDWASFANSLGHKELLRLDKAGILYRVPPPGAKVVNGKLRVFAMYPGLPVEMSYDGGVTWQHATVNATVHIGTVHLRTRSADGARTSRVVTMDTDTSSSAASLKCLSFICCSLLAILFIFICSLV